MLMSSSNVWSVYSLNHLLEDEADDILNKAMPQSRLGSFFSFRACRVTLVLSSCHASCVASKRMFGFPRGRRVKNEALGHRRTLRLGIYVDEF